MIRAWNDHMMTIFIESWMSYLDESMHTWTAKLACPRWMCTPRKPHPMDNEHHAIFYSSSGKFFGMKLVEGKYALKDRPALEFNSCAKSAAVLLRLRKNMFRTDKAVIYIAVFVSLKL